MESYETKYGKVELHDEQVDGFLPDHSVKITIAPDGAMVCTVDESAEGILPAIEQMVKEAGSELVPAFGRSFVAVDLLDRPLYWVGRFSGMLQHMSWEV